MVPPVVSLTQELVGDGAVGLAVGILLLWHSIGAAVGAYGGGHIYSSSGGYGAALAWCGGLCVLAAVALAWLPYEPVFRNRNRDGASDAVSDTAGAASRRHSRSAQPRRTRADGAARPVRCSGGGRVHLGPATGDPVPPGGTGTGGTARTAPRRVTEV